MLHIFPHTRWRPALAALLLLSLLIVPQQARAATPHFYLETGHYLGGGFRDFWEANGGLPVFGFPITEEYTASNGRVTQYFERAQFEFFPENAGTPHMVQLGHLGRQASGGLAFPQIPPRQNDANHRYFPETKHMIMWGFKETWEKRGGLAIFGYPLSEEIMEVLPADGKWHVVQYFERARFEYWPDYKPGERVLISDLGRRFAPPQLTAPLPPGTPPGTLPGSPVPPPSSVPALPANIKAYVDPTFGPPGSFFTFDAFGFTPGEEVSVWATDPAQVIYPASEIIFADEDGWLTSSGMTLFTNEFFPTGVWNIVAQGRSSGNLAIAYFVILGNATAPPSQPLPENKSASVVPQEGPVGTGFLFYGYGFIPGELVDFKGYYDDGSEASPGVTFEAPDDGVAFVQYTTSADSEIALRRLVARGHRSGHEAYAWIRVTAYNPTHTLTVTGLGARRATRPTHEGFEPVPWR